MRQLIDHIWRIWYGEERAHMREIAHRHYLRTVMDGEVIQKSGEIIPKESA
mgnify:CR=1 FL=1